VWLPSESGAPKPPDGRSTRTRESLLRRSASRNTAAADQVESLAVFEALRGFAQLIQDHTDGGEGTDGKAG
jgi:hypothetical protein